MANFNMNVNGAFAVSGLTALTFFKADMISPQMFVACVIMGTVGGLLPDLDSNNSIPVRVGFMVFSLMIAFACVIWMIERLSGLELLALWFMAFTTMRYVVFPAISNFTVHRGVIHSVPYLFLFALAAVYWCFYAVHMTAKNSWFIGLFVGLGCLVHFILDEVYSVNLLGMKIKKSFGTALKLYDEKGKYWYVLLYALVLVGFSLAPSSEEFLHVITSKESWYTLKENLLPY